MLTNKTLKANLVRSNLNLTKQERLMLLSAELSSDYFLIFQLPCIVLTSGSTIKSEELADQPPQSLVYMSCSKRSENTLEYRNEKMHTKIDK